MRLHPNCLEQIIQHELIAGRNFGRIRIHVAHHFTESVQDSAKSLAHGF